MSKYLLPEPDPKNSTEHPECWPAVVDYINRKLTKAVAPHKAIMRKVAADGIVRHEQGIDKYGVPLRPFNGRDSLHDQYQEAMDGLVYSMQDLMESNLNVDTDQHDKIETFELWLTIAIRIRERIEMRKGD